MALRTTASARDVLAGRIALLYCYCREAPHRARYRGRRCRGSLRAGRRAPTGPGHRTRQRVQDIVMDNARTVLHPLRTDPYCPIEMGVPNCYDERLLAILRPPERGRRE